MDWRASFTVQVSQDLKSEESRTRRSRGRGQAAPLSFTLGHYMNKHNTNVMTVYDSGYAHIRVRLFCLAISSMSLLVFLDCGFLGGVGGVTTPHGPVIALIGTFVLSFFCGMAVFGRRRIHWDPTRQQLRVVDRLFFFWLIQKKYSNFDIQSIRIRFRIGCRGVESWDVELIDNRGCSHSLIAFHSLIGFSSLFGFHPEVAAHNTADRIGAAIGKEVIAVGGPVPLSQRSTLDLVFGFAWLTFCTFLAAVWMGCLLYQGGFRGIGTFILLPAFAFFLWIGSKGIWHTGRELYRRRKRRMDADQRR